MAFNAYMHDRNIYKKQPDFTKLAIEFPAFRKYVIPDAKGQKVRVDFTDPEALRMVTKILLKKDFNLDIEIPVGFLVPTIPQRLNYILWIEDLLDNIPSKKDYYSGVDIGTGACAIFSILGAQKNDWRFLATESSDSSIHWANKNIEKNNLQDKIKVMKVEEGKTLDPVLSSNEECYDFCMCNPPFFENADEIRKKHQNSDETIADVAQKEEIFVKGGELDFVKSILDDSLVYKDRICLYTTMFGKKKNFLEVSRCIKDIKGVSCTTTEFCQGNTIRWGIAWTFNESIKFEQKAKKRVKAKKEKPPLEYQIPLKDTKNFHIDVIVMQAKTYLSSLQISFKVLRSSQNFAELLLKSDKNTWTHQRRKRRELERQKKGDDSTVSPSKPSEIPLANSSEEKDTKEVHISVKTEASVEHSCVDDQTTEKSDSLNSSCFKSTSADIKSPEHVALSSQSSESDCTSTTNVSEHGKRKHSISPDKCTENKRIKLDANEKSDELEEDKNKVTVKMEAGAENALVKLEADTEMTVPADDSTSNVDRLSSENEFIKLEASTENVSVKLEPDEMLDSGCSHKNVVGEKNSGSSAENRIHDSEPEGLVLNCTLQFIRGKTKIYVKMNCPPTADRNVMYQVFQLLKNKINKY